MKQNTPEYCIQCGEPFVNGQYLHEGVCYDCCIEDQKQLEDHGSSYDWWENLSDNERKA